MRQSSLGSVLRAGLAAALIGGVASAFAVDLGDRITAASIKAALGAVEQGRVIELPRDASSTAEMYIAADCEQPYSDFALGRFRIDDSPPFIAPGVLIDVAAYKGVDSLDAGYTIIPQDLQGALDQQGTELPEGAIVLIHTGWGKRYAKTGPGIGPAASKWLAAHKPVAIGADMTLEVVLGEDSGLTLPLHVLLGVDQGGYIETMENVDSAELAAGKHYRTAILMLPTKYSGATVTPARIVALY